MKTYKLKHGDKIDSSSINTNGKVFSTNDFTDEYKTKVEGLSNYKSGSAKLLSIATGSIKYEVLNGICNLFIAVRASSDNISSYTNIATGIPKPKIGNGFFASAVNSQGSAIRMGVTTDGSIQPAETMTGASNYVCNITYTTED